MAASPMMTAAVSPPQKTIVAAAAARELAQSAVMNQPLMTVSTPEMR